MQRMAVGIIGLVVIALALGLGYGLGSRGGSPASAQATWQRQEFGAPDLDLANERVDAFLATLDASCRVDVEPQPDTGPITYEVFYAC